MQQLNEINESTVEDALYKMKQEKAKVKKDAPKWTWNFSSASFIDIYRNDACCAHFHYDDKLKVKVTWTGGQLSKDDWTHMLDCVKEAKDVLKKIRSI